MGQAAGQHESTASVVAAIVANIAIGVVKFVAAGFSGSSAMVSEGIHSIVDSGNGLLVLLGIHRAAKPADDAHPFGHGKELYFWTLVVSVMIFALGGGFSIYEGTSHLIELDPTAPLGDPTIGIIVIVASFLIEGASLRVGLKTFNEARAGRPVIAFIREAKDPSLYTVVLEDTAAEAGLVVAFLGVVGSHALGNPYLDGAASVLIGLILCMVAIFLLVETKSLLIGEGLTAAEVAEVRAIVEESVYVRACGRVLSLYMGPEHLLIAVDASFVPDASREHVLGAVDSIEAAIKRRFPAADPVFIEGEDLKTVGRQLKA